MKRISSACALLLVSLTCACSGGAISQHKDIATTQKADGEGLQNQELRRQIEQIGAAAEGRVGVAAVVLEIQEADGTRQEAGSGDLSERWIVSLNPHERFPMQSVYKLPIGMAVLQRVDAGTIKLDQKVRVAKSDFVRQGQHSPIRDKNPDGAELSVSELLRFAISESDGTASDVLMRLAGGPEAVQAYLDELKINEMVVLNSEKEIGQDWQTQYRNWASPEAAVALLRALHERRGLSETSQALVLKLMAESTPGRQRLKGLLPPGTVVAHKTGTSGAQNGVTAATNDIGIVTITVGGPVRGSGGRPVGGSDRRSDSGRRSKHFAVAVFAADSPADQETREGVIAKIARAIWDVKSKQ